MANFQNYYIYLPSLLISLGLAFYIFFQDRKDERNQVFALMSSIASLWLFALLISDYTKDAKMIFFWSQFAIIPPSFVPPLVLYFSFIFPQKRVNISIFTKLFLGIFPLVFCALAFTPYNVVSVARKPWGTDVVPGPLYSALVIYFFIFIIFSIYNFVKSYKSLREKIYKSQILYVITGLIFMIVVNLLTNAIFVILGNSQFAAFGTASILVFLGLTMFAIVETHLFDIRVIATEVLVVLIGLALLIDTLLSKTLLEGGLKGILFVFVSYGSYKLVQSVKEEIRRRQEIQKLTNQLKKANVRLQELDRMKSEFLSVASHELNSPMSIIKGYLHMILWEGFGKVDKNARTYLEKVYMKTDQLAKLVADLLNVSRIEQGRIQLDIKPVDIQPILKDICEDHAIKAKEKGLTFTYHESKQPLPNVLSDADKFKEILQNLLSNAIKFTKTGGVEVSVGQKDGFVKVSVKDTGVGIPKEAQEHIFEKFYRVDNSWVREVGGTGLGLYIVREYLKLMNGKIWFESEGEDKGTTFYFALPIAEPGDTHHEIKELTIEGKERPEYTKSPQDEIKESLERIKNHNHNNHEQEKKSLKDQLLANKEEREKMKEKILKEAEEFRKQQKTQKDL